MGLKVVKQSNGATTDTNTIETERNTTTETKKRYQFFNYRDENVWGSKDLMEKYLSTAENIDKSSNNPDDGYLSRKEFNALINCISKDDRKNILKNYYEFFNYNDENAWPNRELMEEFKKIASEKDIHSPDSSRPDGYLSKYEFEKFKQWLSEEEIELFPNCETSLIEKKFKYNDSIYPDIIEDSEYTTKKDKRIINITSSIAGTGAITMLIAGLGMMSSGYFYKGHPPAWINQIVNSTALIGFAVATVGIIADVIGKKIIKNKIKQQEELRTLEAETNKNNSEISEQKSEGV